MKGLPAILVLLCLMANWALGAIPDKNPDELTELASELTTENESVEETSSKSSPGDAEQDDDFPADGLVHFRTIRHLVSLTFVFAIDFGHPSACLVSYPGSPPDVR
jgi:hypothetical protein